MSLETIISLLLGIPIGLVSGLYTGLIVTRYARFAELRNETLRIIRTIDFMQDGSKVDVSNDHDVPKLVLISSDLLFLGHRTAGEQTMKLFTEMSNTNYSARAGKIGVEEYAEHCACWQKIARELPGSKLVLWSVWGRL